MARRRGTDGHGRLVIFKMGKQLQSRRLLLLVGMLGGAFALLAFRLLDLQVFRHEELKAKAQANTVRELRIQPRRGDILDAQGNLLASSTMVKTVCADPTLIGNRQAEVARAIAPILGMKDSEVQQKLFPKVTVRNGQTNVSRYARIKTEVPIETWEKVKLAMTNLKFPDIAGKKLTRQERAFYDNLRTAAIATEAVDDQVRNYPNKALAAHVLGFVGRNGDTNSAEYGQMIGVEGVERTLNEKLAGTRGWRVTEKDRRQHELVSLRSQDVPARDGFNVVLTIDSVIQHMLESALANGMKSNSPANITGIVIRPRTGEILAMATLPDFDPNNVPRDQEVRRNRIVGDVVEPGSTFKIVVVSAALNERIVTLNDMFFCENGEFNFAGRTLHDHDSQGNISVERIITKSSNIGAAKIGIKLGEEKLFDYMNRFGFGAQTGIPLPGESRGILHPVDDWTKVSIAQIPMGHGVSVTRLQMAMAMSAIANNGWLMRPMLVNRLQDRDGRVMAQYQPERVRQVISNQTAKQMVRALKTVVTSEGTAPAAQISGYTVAGKTGTAQKPVPGGYSSTKFVTSFIGFFPADNPELCISIVLDEPKNGHYGGKLAAPIFSEVGKNIAGYLNIRPETGGELSDVASLTPVSVVDFRSVKTVATKTTRTQ